MNRPMTRAMSAVWGLITALWLSSSAFAQGQVVEYYHLDALGTVRAVTDEAGTVLERHDYLPFGEELCGTVVCGSSPGGQSKRFTGKERDAETGLDYFGARYFGSKTGRFTTIDPVYTWQENLEDPQRWNRYAYGRNNPLRHVDPDGRVIETPWDAANLAIGLASLGSNIAAGNVGGALLDAVGVVFDAAATVVPGLPGGAGTAIKAARAASKIDNAIDAAKGVEFTADLSRTAAKSRSGHSYAGNKQIHEVMMTDAARRADMEAKYGSDVLARTSTSGGGRRNPRGTEWDHNSADPKALDLRSKEGHLEKTRREGQAGGGWKRFHKATQE